MKLYSGAKETTFVGAGLSLILGIIDPNPWATLVPWYFILLILLPFVILAEIKWLKGKMYIPKDNMSVILVNVQEIWGFILASIVILTLFEVLGTFPL